MMTVLVNGTGREVVRNARLSDVLNDLDLPDTGVAVAVNDEFIPRPLWTEVSLDPGVRVEILTAVQGG